MSYLFFFFFFKQKTAYEMRISDWSSDVCSSDLRWRTLQKQKTPAGRMRRRGFLKSNSPYGASVTTTATTIRASCLNRFIALVLCESAASLAVGTRGAQVLRFRAAMCL